MLFAPSDVLRIVHEVTRPGSVSLSTWPVSPDSVSAQDVIATHGSARRVRPGEITEGTGDASYEEMEILAHRGELFRDRCTGRLFAPAHLAEILYRGAVEDFYTATRQRFGSLTDYGPGHPDWSIPLGEGQTVRVGFAEKSRDDRYRRVLIGLDPAGEPTWVLEAPQ